VGAVIRIDGKEILGPSTSATSSATLTTMRLQIVPVVDDPKGRDLDVLGQSVSVEVEVEVNKGDKEGEEETLESCPPATQDVALNLKNREKSIKVAAYGPLNPSEPNEDFWQVKADRWKVTIDEAKTALCGNCAAFDTTDPMRSCIETGLSGESDEWSAVDAGDLGYCEVFDFKCASARTCDAWIARSEGQMMMDPEDEMLPDDVEEDFHTMMVLEGVWTGDGRYIEEGALGWRDLPLPLMATDRTTEGHMNAVLIGRLTRIERMGREIHAYGSYVKTDDPSAMSLQNLVRNGELRGVSVDLDSLEYEVIVPTEAPTETLDPATGEVAVSMDDLKMRVTSARVMGATVVPFPAFQEAFIENVAALTASIAVRPEVTGWISQFASYSDIDFTPPQGARDEAEKGLEWRSEFGRGGTEVGVARARDISNGKSLSPDTITRMVSYFARHEVDKQGTGWSPGEDGFPSAGRIAWALWGGDPGMTWANKIKNSMSTRDERGSIVASGHPIEAPVVPPSSWFANPRLTEPTPLTVDDSGRVYGHLAVWGQCHVGFGDRCIQPPHSPAAYAHFLTGEILCDDGFRFPVGQITMNSGHAPQSASASQTAAHYDNTALAAADVTAGEDDFGIWVSGALRTGLDASDIRALMASDVSGDWRRIGGSLELVAVLAVNVPGFPKIRVKESLGLVASLSLPAYEGDNKHREDLLARAAHRIATSIGRSKTDRIAEIARRIKGDK
jgi:hypothetical protein